MSSNFPYAIIFTGETSSFRAAVQEVKGELSTLGPLTVKWGEAATAQLGRMPTLLWRALFGFQMLNWMMSMLVMRTYQQTLAQESLEDAQDRYNEAVREFGVGSEQAQQAARQLERQQIMIARANQLAAYSYVALGMQGVSAIISMLPLLASLTTSTWTYVTALKAQAIAFAMAHPWLVAGMIGAGIAVGAMMTYGAMQQNINVNIDNRGQQNLGRAFDEAERQATYKLRTASGQ